MRGPRPSRVVPWLLLAVVVLIIYGSLYPFEFQPDAVEGGLLEALASLSWARAGMSDRVSNVLLYVPFGFCAFLLAEVRLSRLQAGLLAVAAGALLSLVIELTQAYVSPRVPSLMDLSLNSAGTLAGAIAGSAWRSLGGFVYVPTRVSTAPAAAAVVVVAWVASRLAPFAFQLDLGKLKAALAPLVRPEFSPVQSFRYLMSWLVVSQALIAIAGRDRGLDLLLGLIATVLVGRLLITTQVLVPAELLALLLLLPGLVVLNGMRHGPRSLLLAAAVVLLIAWLELVPFTPASNAATFDLWPFLGWIEAGYHLDARWILERLFLYAALLWLLREFGLGSFGSGLALVCVVLLTEVALIWQAGGAPSVTRPALAAALAAGLGVLDGYRRRSRRDR